MPPLAPYWSQPCLGPHPAHSTILLSLAPDCEWDPWGQKWASTLLSCLGRKVGTGKDEINTSWAASGLLLLLRLCLPGSPRSAGWYLEASNAFSTAASKPRDPHGKEAPLSLCVGICIALRALRKEGSSDASPGLTRQGSSQVEDPVMVSKEAAVSLDHSSSIRRTFPLLETCPCHLVNLVFPRLVRNQSLEENLKILCPGGGRWKHWAVPYKVDNLGGKR